MRAITSFGVVALALVAGCGTSGRSTTGQDGLEVVGRVIDFQSGQEVSGAVSVSTHGVAPAPTVTIAPPAFTLDGVAAHSVFYVLASADGHRATFSTAIDVEDSDVDGVDVRVVADSYLAQLASAFGVTPTAASGVLLAQVVDAGGAPRAGVPASAFAPIANARGPFFLAADRSPAPTATQTSSSGWVVYFEIAPGVANLSSATGAAYTVDMAVSPIAPATITVATAHVTDGPPALPKDVSFSTQVAPIFQSRGCQACHSGSGPGKDLANLTLDGSVNLMHRELLDASVTSTVPRIDLAAPEKSLVLTMPSFESPPDGHPTVVFASPLDKDYLTILVWIREGARQN